MMIARRVKLTKLIKSIRHEKLATIPEVLFELLRISRDPLADACDLAKVCERDPVISARLLKTANSVYYGRPDQKEVSNITEAIIRLGFRKAQEIIMSATVCSALMTTRSSDFFSMWELWKHAYAVGVANRLLYDLVFGRSEFDPFLSGLLHDLGIIIENQFLYDDGFAKAVKARHDHKSMLIDEESYYLGFTHEDVGEAVAREWNFPEHIMVVIGHHHDRNVETSRFAHLLHATRLAEWLTFVLHMGYSDFSEYHTDELLKSREILGVSDEILNKVATSLENEIESMSHMGWFPYTYLRAVS